MNVSRDTNKHLATLAMDAEIRFQSVADRAAFSYELTKAVTALVARYHDESAPGGRAHRPMLVSHPVPRRIRTKGEA